MYNFNENGTAISPIDMMLYVYFTNEKDVAYMIDSCWVECQTQDGSWKKMYSADLRLGSFLVGPDLQHVKKVEFGEDGFSAAAERRNIGPHETIQGWLLLVLPKEGYTGDFRFHVRTTTDDEFVEPVAKFKADSPPRSEIQKRTWKSLSDWQDVSSIPVRVLEPK